MNKQARGAWGAWAGLAVGALVGQTEAWLHASANAGWGLEVFAVAISTDALLGAAAGALWSRLRGGPPRTVAFTLGAVAALSTGLGVGAAARIDGAPAGVGQGAPAVDVVWIAVSGLRADAIEDPTITPNLNHLRDESLWWPRAWAPTATPDVALATLLTGRLPPGSGATAGAPLPDDVPTIAEEAARWQVPTRAVLSADPSFSRGFGEVVRPRPARLLGLSPTSAQVLFWRALDALIGPKGPERAIGSADEIVDAVRGWASGDGPVGLMFVHLNTLDAPLVDAGGGPGDPKAIYTELLSRTDAEIGAILDALGDRRSKAVIMITGVEGRALGETITSDAARALSPRETRVPWIVRLPEGPRDVRVASQASTADFGPSALMLLERSEAEVWDGRPQVKRAVRNATFDGSLLCNGADVPGCVQQRAPLSLPWPDATEEPPLEKVELPPPPAPAPLTAPGITPEQAAASVPPPTPKPPEPKPERPVLGVEPGTQLILDPNQHNPCDQLTATFGVDAVIGLQPSAEGGAWVIRSGGYALHLSGADPATASWRMYDLKHDPDEVGPTVAREAVTCGGTIAKDRAAQMITALRAAVDASKAGHDRDLPTSRPSAARRGDMPDPDAKR